MKKFLFALAVSVALAGDYEIIKEGGYHHVEVSLTDINRIVCDTEITGVVYSREKSMEVRKKGKNAWLKILPVKEGNKISYPSYPRELYVECGGRIFSLIVLPKKVPARTILLKVPSADVRKALSFEKGNRYEETLLELVKSVYSEVPPPGYRVRNVGKKEKEFREVDLYLLRIYEGVRYEVREYLVKAKTDVELSESAFVPYVPRPLALSVVKPLLKKGEVTRLIAVSLREN